MHARSPGEGTQNLGRWDRSSAELFLISLIVLFLELTCIRWFPAHVPFLTFFTNTVLLASFLGMSVGCLAARRPESFILWTPIPLAGAMAAAHLVELLRSAGPMAVRVGNVKDPQVVFFGSESFRQDMAQFLIPVELLEGFFFLVIALIMLGPGQELGRALARIPSRLRAYTVNVLGSMVGIVLFSAFSYWELAPPWWFATVALGLAYFLILAGRELRAGSPWPALGCLAGVVAFASLTSGPYAFHGQRVGWHLWSPYYRIDYDVAHGKDIHVNLIAHQAMVSRESHDDPGLAYALPYLLRRDSGQEPFHDVLVIGAGTGNDVSRALQWGSRRVDAVEIGPVILRLGLIDHPDHPYQDGRVTSHLDDGRNFLRTAHGPYDLIIYALVDSLVLHSSYSNIRLESYLFTRQAFEDVRRHLKPGGLFVVYNYFRHGWIVARLHETLRHTFGCDPLALTLPYRPVVEPDTTGGFTVLIAGGTETLREAFRNHPEYWLRADLPPNPDSPNGFLEAPLPEKRSQWERLGVTRIVHPDSLMVATDDWPFLYLRRPMIPALTFQGIIIMGGLALLMLIILTPNRPAGATRLVLDGRMFFLGAGFMLIETKAVVHMALLFGSTWIINTVVFMAVLGMILLANLHVVKFRPKTLHGYYAGLFATLALHCLIPLDWFLGRSRSIQVLGASLLVFSPIFFAGVIFAACFERTGEPDVALGANVAGAILGGLAENVSMLLGFQYLSVVPSIFYGLSALLGTSRVSGDK